VTKLVENYRSHPALVQLPSQLFYNSELIVSAEKSLIECLCPWDQLPNRNSFPILFHGVRVRLQKLLAFAYSVLFLNLTCISALFRVDVLVRDVYQFADYTKIGFNCQFVLNSGYTFLNLELLIE